MSSKGTIIYIGGFEMPDKNAAAHRVVGNAKILRDLGYDVVFIGVDRSCMYSKKSINTKRSFFGFDCWSIPYPKTSRQWINYLVNIDSTKKILSMYPQVVSIICYNYPAIALYRIIKLSKKKKFKVISDCTEWYSARQKGILYFIIKGFDTLLRMRILHKKMDGLIVISHYLKQYYYKQKNRICLPPLIDKSDSKWNINVNDFKNLNEEITFVYAGSPGSKDKVDILVEVLSKIDKPFKLYIFGITIGQYLDKFPDHEQILHNNKGKIHFWGIQKNQIILQYIKQADFSCFLRENNRLTQAGFPTKFVESISCGTPVITTRNSDLAEFMHEGKNGFFVTLDKDYLINFFKKIFDFPKYKIINMKKFCKSDMDFNYQNYIGEVKELMYKLR